MVIWLFLGSVWGATSVCAPSIDTAQLDIALSRTSTKRARYRFRAPPASCEFVVLPRTLDGMTVAGSDQIVRDGRILRNPTWEEGIPLVVERTTEMGSAPHSDELVRPPFSVGRTSVSISTPSSARLQVWHDPEAKVAIDVIGRTRTYRANFAGSGRLVFTTEKDWWSVGTAFEKAMAPKYPNRRESRTLADPNAPLSVAQILQQVDRDVPLVRGSRRSWRNLPRVVDILAAKRGTASERALVLASLLKANGHNAQLVMMRLPSAEPVPLDVPAHALFKELAVRILDEDGTEIWLDPTSASSETNAVPRRLRGATFLIPGDQPQTRFDDLTPDGLVQIQSDANLDEQGSINLTAQVQATGGAVQALRDILRPLPKDRRKQWLADLLRVVRPELDDLRFQVYGVDDPSLPFGMSLEFEAPGSFRPMAHGRAGSLPAALALQLARVLPPNLEVVETLTFTGHGDLRPQSVSPIDSFVDAEAVLHRELEITERGAVVETRVLRPWRRSDRALDTALLLDQASLEGPQILLYSAIDRAAVRAPSKDGANSETKVLEALLWLKAEDSLRAEKAMRRAIRTSRVRDVAHQVGRLTRPDDETPWDLLWSLLPADHDRMHVVRALEDERRPRQAWMRASQLLRSESVDLQIEALLIIARVQGERPAANRDKAAHKAWRDPVLLLKRAEKLAMEDGQGHRFDIDVALAERYLERDVCDLAGPVVARAAPQSSTPDIRAVQAAYSTCPGEEIVDIDLESLVTDSGFAPDVIRTAGRVWKARGEAQQSRVWSYRAALLEQNDMASWMLASDAAIAAGDLVTAVHAARRASDLDTRSLVSGIPYQIRATLLGDKAGASLATKRSGYRVSVLPFPIELTEADRFLRPEDRLAFLRHRDADVLSDKRLLEERRQANQDIGDSQASARDAAWLIKEHRDPNAIVEQHRHWRPHVWSSHPVDSLNRAVRDSRVRALRLEDALVTGVVDPLADARALRDDPTAQRVQEARYRTRELAERVDWPVDPSDPKVDTPAGMRRSRVLSALPGVQGYVHPSVGVSLVVSTVPRLPPPLAGTFQLGTAEAVGPVVLYTLEGGLAPAYAAKRTLDGVTLWGIARQKGLALYALESGVAALP